MVDYEKISGFIPEYLNALYNNDAFNSTSLDEIRDAFRKKQIIGKTLLLQLVKEYCTTDQKILVVGSWIGFTSFSLNKLGYSNITEVDPDARLEPLTKWANRFNKNFKHITADINHIDTSNYDVIINTSCEHIDNNTWFNITKPETLLILQSTDYKEWDHTNTCETLEEMISKYPMNILHAEELDLDQYKRFMLVGIK